MRRLRVAALSGAMLIGLAVPSVVEADGKAPASTYLVSLRPLAGASGAFAALQAANRWADLPRAQGVKP